MNKPKAQNQTEVIMEGNLSGQLAIGNNIHQKQTIKINGSGVSEAELKALHDQIENLRQEIIATAPPGQQEQALERVSELEDAITAETPDLTTMEYVKNWFGKNLPQLAGTVTAVVVNPIVGKLVEAAGEAVVHEFQARFGSN